MNISLAVLGGYLLDGFMGDPRWFPHPVRAIGWLISVGERRLNWGGPSRRLVAGTLLALGVIGASAGVAGLLVFSARLINPLLADFVTALGVGVLLARKSLADEAGRAVSEPLCRGDLAEARWAVGRVVGRDTAELDESSIARAAVETLAENTSDGIVGPLLFALIGGLPAMAAYKAISTLDSMIGHLDDRYRYFGRFAARLDDAANLAPARVTALALALAATISGRDGRNALTSARADAGKHASPNAGWPEAAMAGALGVRLGGLNFYDGEPHLGPLFNSAKLHPQPHHISAAVALTQWSSHLVLIAGVLVRTAITFGGT